MIIKLSKKDKDAFAKAAILGEFNYEFFTNEKNDEMLTADLWWINSSGERVELSSNTAMLFGQAWENEKMTEMFKANGR